MTNKFEISRELAQEVDDLLYILTGHDSLSRLVHKYGKDWWEAVDGMRGQLCTLLAAPVVDRQEPVAYQARHSENEPWFFTDKPGYWQWRPLYTSPLAPVVVPAQSCCGSCPAGCVIEATKELSP